LSLRLRPSSPAFTVYLALLSGLPPLSIDMGLPALGAIQSDLGASAGAAALTLSLFLAGFTAGPLFMGPLADRFGRKPVLLAGLTVFGAAGLACAAAPSLGLLLAARFVQGLGAGAGSALPVAIIRDLYEGVEARRRLAAVALVSGLAPILAPLLGAGLLAVTGWRGIYGLLGVGGVGLLAATLAFEESAPDGSHHRLDLRGLAATYAAVLRDPDFRGHALLNAACFGAMFAYISSSSLVLMDGFGVSSGAFSLLFGCTAGCSLLGAYLSGRSAKAGVEPRRLIGGGLGLGASATAAFLGLALAGWRSPWAVVPPVMVYYLGQGLIMPALTHEAMQPMGERAGVAASTMRALQMAVGAGSGMLVAWLFDGRTALATAGIMAAFSAGALLYFHLGLRAAAPRGAGRGPATMNGGQDG
jgi:DHA1 family bicyclomycin/chloramphenicol resistance-like MFS transporter